MYIHWSAYDQAFLSGLHLEKGEIAPPPIDISYNEFSASRVVSSYKESRGILVSTFINVYILYKGKGVFLLFHELV